jgi:hypothetical protein
MRMSMPEWRARYECAIQYRTYLNLSGLAQTYFDNGDTNIGLMLNTQAIMHRQFARNCAWIAIGSYQ